MLFHRRLGTRVQPSGKENCRALRRLAGQARRANARVAYVPRPHSVFFVPARGRFPPAWYVDSEDPLSLHPVGPGQIERQVDVRRPGSYELWVSGSFGRGYQVSVDGRRIGDIRYQLNPRGQYGHVGELTLARGRHVVMLARGGGDLRPGNGGANRLLGPVVLSPAAAQSRTVRYIEPRRFEELCGSELDWVELVRG